MSGKTLFMCFVLLLLISYLCTYVQREKFITERYDKFFILQRKPESYDSTETTKSLLTMTSIDDNVIIGHTTIEEKYLFERLYRIHNNNKLNNFEYKKLENEYSFDGIDILLYTKDTIYLSNYLIIDYYFNSIEDQFKEYDFVVHNDKNNSTLVLKKKQHVQHIIDLKPKVSLSNEYNFIIENAINGRYTEKDLRTNEIALFQNKLYNLEVKVNDIILLRKQKYPYMNGVYKVYKVNKNIYMLRENIVVPNQHNVCMDEDLVERPEYTNKMSCEHENDVFGEKKNKIMTWDSRCRRNMECPFFDEEYNYPCNDGYCVMPKDVKQISFTKYI